MAAQSQTSSVRLESRPVVPGESSGAADLPSQGLDAAETLNPVAGSTAALQALMGATLLGTVRIRLKGADGTFTYANLLIGDRP